MKNLLIFLIMIPVVGWSQNYKILSQIEMEVAGTSTLHDWEMTSEEGYGSADFNFEDGQLKDIKSLSFGLKTESLKSGKSTMDKICYESMKTDRYKDITFSVTEILSVTKSGSAYTIRAKGNLKIAGVSKPVELNVTGRNGGSQVEFSGKFDMKMTDFKIDPPTAVFGTIKTGDAITVSFNVKYKVSSSS